MSLQVWLPLNGNLNNQGTSGVTVTNSGATVDSSGKIGQCYYFNGNNSWIKVSMPSSITSIKNTSICAWVKSTGSVVALGGISNDTNYADAIVTLYTSGWQFSGESGYKYISGGSIANTSVWHHVCCTIDDTTITTYLDGTKVTSNTLSGLGVAVTTISSNNFIEIGCDHPGGNEFLTGYVNDFRVYDHCLSPKEVKEISKALICHYPLDNRGFGFINPNLIKNTANGNGWTCSTFNKQEKIFTRSTTATSESFIQYKTDLENTKTYTMSAEIKTNGQVANVELFAYDSTVKDVRSKRIADPPTDWTKVFLTFTPNSSYSWTNCNIRFDNNGSKTSGTEAILFVKNIKVEEGSVVTPWCPHVNDPEYTYMGYNNTTEYDTSGYKYNGIKTGTLTISSDTSRYSCSTEFSKAGYISCSSFGVSTSQFTLNFWVKPKTATSQHFIFGTFTSWTGNGFGIYRNSDTTKYECVLRSPEESSYKSRSLTPELDVWSMLTIVYTGTTYTGYLNGVQKFSDTYGLNGVIINPVFMVGNSKYNSTPASENEEAFISDVRYYAIALSADDIKELYQTSASITNNGAVISYDFTEA